MPLFQKKPVQITAVQFTGTNFEECLDFGSPDVYKTDNGYLKVRTLEGKLFISPSDWIIRGVKGEFYPCRNDIFQETYDEIPVYVGELKRDGFYG